MLWLLYNLIFPLVFLLMLPKFLSRMLRRGGYRRHFEQRLGQYGHRTAARLNEGRRIWIHAVSVGEINIALRFIDAYRKEHPAALFVLSTTTSTAHAIGEEILDDRDVLIYLPLDMPFVINRVLNVINPRNIILVECEFWPNLVRLAHKRGVPVALINGRISDSSFKGYMKLRAFTRQILQMIAPVCVQGRQDAERVLAMGARPEAVHTLGTAKYDLPPPTADAAAPARAVLRQSGVPDTARILLGGSTWSGEEEVLCKIYKKLKPGNPDLFLVLVPRHAERRDEVVTMLEEQGLSFVLRSRRGLPVVCNMSGASEKNVANYGLTPSGAADVLVVDTTGELMGFYAASDLVFVGKSLCEQGGQNPIEPAFFGKPILVGPNMENFPTVVDDFLSAGALRQVADSSALEEAVDELLGDEAACMKLGEAARSLVETRRGVAEKMVQVISAAC